MLNIQTVTWVKAFKSGRSTFCGRQTTFIYPFNFFKGCLPQNLLSSFLNTLSNITNGEMHCIQFIFVCIYQWLQWFHYSLNLVIELLLNFIKEMCQAQFRPFMRPASLTLPPFVELMQNFILMQNTQKRDSIGRDEIFGTLLLKKSLFSPILDANLIFQIRPCMS